ncbi:MAG: class I SAM-dependent methyltransferase, partial [Chloroflexota bacterium]
MLERNLHRFQSPKTQQPASKLEILEQRVINGVEHVYQGYIHFGDEQYPIEEGIVCLGSHKNSQLYNQIWEGDFKKERKGENQYGVSRQEKLLNILGYRSLGWLEQKTFLDVGSGLGRFTHAAVELGADAMALDSSIIGLKYTRDRLAEELSKSQFARCDFVQAD